MDKLPEGWTKNNFGTLVENFDGKRIPLSVNERDKRKGNVPYYGASGIIDYIDNFIFEGEFLLISEDGANLLMRTYPIAFIARGKFWVNNHAHIVRAKSNLTSNQYLEYFFSLKDISEYVTGSAQPKLNQRNLNKIPIPLPPLPEQKRIISKLDALFERIDQSIALLEENIKNTEALMASALDEVFLQLAQFSKALKISDFAEVKGGKRLPKGFKVQEDKTEFPYIRVADFLDNGTINMSNLQYISPDAHEKIKRYIITSEDLYISIAGTIGKTGIIPKELDGANLTENAARLVYKNPSSINNRYIYFFTLSDKFKQQIKEATKTVAQPKLALTRLKNIELPVPTINIQNEAVNKFDSISSKTYALMKEQEAKLNHLKSLKESILDKAFKGEF